MTKEKPPKEQNLPKRGFKICFISNYPPTRGRLAEYSYNLINELQKLPEIEHIDILVNTNDTKSDKVPKINEKIQVHQTWTTKNPLSLLFVPLKALRLIPDVVHFNVHMAVFGKSRLANFFGLSLPLICRSLGLKTVVTLHNVVERVDIEKTGFCNTFLNRSGAFIATKLLTHSSYLVMTMKSYVKLLKERYKCKNLVWIPHGTWNVVPRKKQGHNPQTILFFGSLGPYKDLDLLFQAFDILSKRRSAIKLIVAGDSHPDYPNFLNMYKIKNEKTNVQFTGYVLEEEFLRFFESIDVVVLPYHTCTGTSGVVHLASSYGIPIIATDLPEFRELIREGCKMALSQHNPIELADKIEYILDNPDLMDKLRKQNLVFACKRTWERIAVSFYELYQQIAHNSAPN